MSKYKTCSDCGQLWDTEAPHGHDCPGSYDERLANVEHDVQDLDVRMRKLEVQNPPTFTIDQVQAMLANVGVDVTCGACMAVAMTGFGGYTHSCGKASESPVIMSLTSKVGDVESHVEWSLPRLRCPKKESGGVQCELPEGHEALRLPCACPAALAEYMARAERAEKERDLLTDHGKRLTEQLNDLRLRLVGAAADMEAQRQRYENREKDR